MPEFSGPIQHVDIEHAHLLWLIALFPLVGAAINAFYSSGLLGKASEALLNAFFRDEEKQKVAPRVIAPNRVIGGVAVGAMLLAFGATVFHVVQIAGQPADHRFLLDHLWRMVRFGQLDINFDFAMDPLSALMCLIITGVGSLIHIYAASYMATDPDYWRFFAWLNLFVFSMLLLVLGDNLFVMFFGWEGVGLCSYGLIGFWWKDYKKATAGMKAFVVNRVGDFGFIMGAALLFWGLGGAWAEEGEYTPDMAPRFSAVSVTAEETSPREGDKAGPPGQEGARGEKDKSPTGPNGMKPDTSGEGSITLTSYPGARVFLDDSRDALKANPKDDPHGLSPELTSPFVGYPIPGGFHTFRISLGNSLEDQLVLISGKDGSNDSHIAIGGKKEVALTVMGPTVTFRHIRDEFAVRDGQHKRAFLDDFLGKRIGSHMLVTIACLLLFVGACGKSAQVPLYVWLPDAMAGPTPVSALIHAATMVTAGIYMITRLSFLFSLSAAACGVIASIGALTALFAATMGFFQYDIKKVLAYSTVSQLGFMFIGVGVGAYWAGVFHLMTHAFFKACLFLAAGSVIHGMHAVEHDEVASQDMRNMGGLAKVMPKTRLAYLIACMAITAVPPGLAGFWSKDEILFKAYTSQNLAHVSGLTIYVLGLLAAACTSFYMWRSYYLTFTGKPRNAAVLRDVHESPGPMTGVLLTLAALSAVAGVFFGWSGVGKVFGAKGPLLEAWLEPVLDQARVHFAEPGAATEYGLMGLSVALAVAAWAFARFVYGPGRATDWDTREQRVPGFALLHNKYWVDEIYGATFVKGTLKLRLVLAETDRWVVDGLVNGVGVACRTVAWINGKIDEIFVDGLVNLVAEGTLKTGNKLRGLQTGKIQNYIYGALGGVAFFAIIQYFLFNK